MAQKKPDMSDIFAATAPQPTTAPVEQTNTNSDLEEGRFSSVGVGLRSGELAALDAIAQELGVSRNAVGRWIIRRFILDYRAGKINASDIVEIPKPKPQIKIPPISK